MPWTLAALWCSLLLAPVDRAPNPSFEESDGGSVAAWEARTPTGPGHAMIWATDQARSGTHSLQITSQDANLTARWRTGQLREVAFQPGTPVTLSAWVKVAGVQRRAQLRLYFLDAAGQVVAQPPSPPLAGDADWTQLRVSATVPETATWAMAYLELFGTGTAWFDDVSWVGEAVAAPGEKDWLTLAAGQVWERSGYEPVHRGGQLMLQVPLGQGPGRALWYVPGPAAQYDVEVVHLDEPDGVGSLELLVDGQSVATHRLDAEPGSETAPATWRIPAVPLLTHSRLTVVGTAHAGEQARVIAVRLRAVAPHGEPYASLEPPPSLQVHTRPEEAANASWQLLGVVNQTGNRANAAREERLAHLATPADWRAEQQRIREHLADYFGPFPERTPLNPQSWGTIDGPGYTIEKLTIESRPGFLVSLNLYLPAHRTGTVPGILLCCGHSDEGKGYQLYHETCLGLVLKGYAVLAMDPMGQGERIEFLAPSGRPYGPVAQHHQLGRPLFLSGLTLAGLRVWDGLRAVDYLAARPEIDADRLGVVGNSGGGQETLLMAAVDERLKVAAAAHPGGSMENTYLNGQQVRDREILSLIAPRACRFIVGDKSGETWHLQRVKDLQRFYDGLGAPDQLDFVWVDGVHNMEQPKRVAAYEWFNRWFAMPADAVEPPLEPLEPEALWCAPHGSTIADLGSRTGLSVAESAAGWPERVPPADAAAVRRQLLHRVVAAVRLGEREPEAVRVEPVRTVQGEGFEAQLVRLVAADRWLTAAWLVPEQPADRPVVLHVAERGKPARSDLPSTAIDLCRAGYRVLSIDVRGTGELDRQQGRGGRGGGYDPDQWARDARAIALWGYSDTSLTSLQTADVRLACDALATLPEAAGQPVVGVGEGKGQLWLLLAAIDRPALTRLVGLHGLSSYHSLYDQPVQQVTEYTWLPGAPRAFDLGELTALVAPRPVTLLAPIDADGEPARDPEAALTWARQLGAQVTVRTDDNMVAAVGVR